MQTPPDIRVQVESVLARLSELVSSRDLMVISEFAEDAVLVGSEAGEVALGIDQLRMLLQNLFAQSSRVSWRWRNVRASHCEGTAWFFAEGEVVITHDATERCKPYRLSGVLGWQGERWLWRQFHGSEPVVQPESGLD